MKLLGWLGCYLLLGLALAGCFGRSPEAYRRAIDEHLGEGDLASALLSAKNLAKAYPEDPASQVLLGGLHQALGDAQSALEAFSRARAAGVDDPAVTLGIYRSQIATGAHGDVIAALQGRRDLSAEETALLGWAYLVAGELDKAEERLAAAAPSAEGHVRLGQLAMLKADLGSARRHYEAALGAAEHAGEASLGLGELELLRGNHAAAIGAFSQAAEDPRWALPANLQLARTHLALGQAEPALQAARAAERHGPASAQAKRLVATALVDLGELDAAEMQLRPLRFGTNAHPSTHYLMALIHFGRGDLDRAQTEVKWYLGAVGHSHDAARLLASINLEAGALEAAAGVLGPLTEYSADPRVFALMSAVRYAQGRDQDALDTMQQSIRLAQRLPSTAGAEAAADDLQSPWYRLVRALHGQRWAAAQALIGELRLAGAPAPTLATLGGITARLQGDAVAARVYFDQALCDDAGFFPALRQLATLALESGNAAEAASLYRDFQSKRPNDARGYAALAELYRDQDDQPAARRALERALALDGEALPTRLMLAALTAQSGHADDALAIIAGARVRDARLVLLQAEILAGRGQMDAARGRLAELERRVPWNAPRSRLHYGIAKLALELGRIGQARRYAVSADFPDSFARLRLLARLELASGRLAQSRAYASELPSDDPSTEDRLLWADLKRAEGDLEQAAADYAGLAPANKQAELRFALLRVEAGDVVAAVPLLEQWIERHGPNPVAVLHLGNAYLATNQRQRAIAQYESLLDRGNPAIMNNLAWLYLEADDPRATPLARRAAALYPDQPEILDTLGWVLFSQQGELVESLALIQKSAEIAPGNPSVQFHLAAIYHAADQRAAARDALAKALAVDAFAEREVALSLWETLAASPAQATL